MQISPLIKTNIVRLFLFTDGANNVDENVDEVDKVDDIQGLSNGDKFLKTARFVYGMGDLGDTKALAKRFGATFRHLHEDSLDVLKRDYLEKNLTLEQIRTFIGQRKNATDLIKMAPNAPTEDPVVKVGKQEEPAQ